MSFNFVCPGAVVLEFPAFVTAGEKRPQIGKRIVEFHTYDTKLRGEGSESGQERWFNMNHPCPFPPPLLAWSRAARTVTAFTRHVTPNVVGMLISMS